VTSGCTPAPTCTDLVWTDYYSDTHIGIALNTSNLPNDWTKCFCTRFAAGNPLAKEGHSLFSDATSCDSTNLDFITEKICTGIAYTPWNWTVQHDQSTAIVKCPSPGQILGTFAAVNIVVAIGGVTFGHRLVVKRLTCGMLGKRNSSSWKFFWIMPLGLQLGANALIAFLIKITPGYQHGFSVYQLTLFLCARPRLTWFIGAVLATSRLGRQQRSEEQGNNSLTNSLSLPISESPWQSFGYSQVIAEFVLQALTTFSVGFTAGFAAKKGMLISGRLPGKSGYYAHLMYSGAFYWLCSALFVFTGMGLGVIMLVRRWSKDADAESKRILARKVQVGSFIVLSTLWIAQWLFWVGFVNVAGET
jgi:hypothetical protein